MAGDRRRSITQRVRARNHSAPPAAVSHPFAGGYVAPRAVGRGTALRPAAQPAAAAEDGRTSWWSGGAPDPSREAGRVDASAARGRPARRRFPAGCECWGRPATDQPDEARPCDASELAVARAVEILAPRRGCVRPVRRTAAQIVRHLGEVTRSTPRALATRLLSRSEQAENTGQSKRRAGPDATQRSMVRADQR